MGIRSLKALEIAVVIAIGGGELAFVARMAAFREIVVVVVTRESHFNAAIAVRGIAIMVVIIGGTAVVMAIASLSIMVATTAMVVVIAIAIIASAIVVVVVVFLS